MVKRKKALKIRKAHNYLCLSRYPVLDVDYQGKGNLSPFPLGIFSLLGLIMVLSGFA